jgi:Asp-tRNA(Asn)/Glu-tRNA(Gln) amidotransferase A subunit family amidase
MVSELKPALFQGISTLDLIRSLQTGEQKAQDVCELVLQGIQQTDSNLRAFTSVVPKLVLEAAQTLDTLRLSGRPLGPLHGMPVVLSDLIDTQQQLTANGTKLDAARQVTNDAAVVERLKANGAILLGKTTISELGVVTPPETVHPMSAEHRPGNSASGAAAAIAAGLAPMGVSLESCGSVLRPAAYCGIYGMQPSHGSISRRGILPLVPTLDVVGLLGRSLADLALLGDVLYGYDAQDSSTRLGVAPRLLETCLSRVPVKPTLAFVDLPYAQPDDETQAALAELEDVLGDQAFRMELPPLFEEGQVAHDLIVKAELSRTLRHYWNRGKDGLSEALQQLLAEGAEIRAKEYLEALDWIKVLRSGLEEILQRCDAFVVPATLGTAPRLDDPEESTRFQDLWNLCGMPVLSVPLFQSTSGMPLGVQLVGPPAGEARLLRTARWLEATVRGESSSGE